MHLFKLVGEDVGLQNKAIMTSSEPSEAEDPNNIIVPPSVITASVHGLLMVHKSDGEEVQVRS